MLHSHLAPALALAAIAAAAFAFADTVAVQIAKPPANGLVKHMGAQSPKQGDIGWDAASLVRDGKPWIPVMGEIHYSRYAAAEWRTELLKMKAGGITLISTYAFWIHHEEEQGKFIWDGDKNLRQFIQTCGEVGLPVIVRIGPWCHGEVRNGGFPDWVQSLPRKRTNDPAYLAAVKPYYDQIGQQLKGLYWKDNGPVVGIQFENEFKGPAAHLVTLKQMGKDAGIDVPIYTRTAWDNATNVPTFGDVLPLWGGYAEGFWDRTLDTMPGNYWQVFQFARDRSPNNAMGSDPTHPVAPNAAGDVQAYPYLTCELGGGMMSSYHRRIDIAPMDVYSVALTKIGSGSNMPGYYMYHGGTNPDGKLSYLMESQSPPQNMWNDMPVKNYDFGAPLGQFGQVRDSYHLARRLHLFLADWGADLARMPAYYGGEAKNKQDATTLRWAVRTGEGSPGFLFVNNYQRGMDMPAKPDTTFKIGDMTIPDTASSIPPVTIPANSAFIWPIGMNVGGPDAVLAYATAQPVCKTVDGNTTYTVFAQTPGVPSDFEFAKGATIDASSGQLTNGEARDWVRNVQPGTNPAIIMHTADGKKQVLFLLTDADSRTIWKGTLAGKEHIFFSKQNLTFDGDKLTAYGDGPGPFVVSLIPPVNAAALGPGVESTMANGVQDLQFALPAQKPLAATAEPLKPAGPLRTIAMGSQKVAAEPTDADFENAATWRIKLPAELKGSNRHVLLRIHYTGDVARIYIGDKLVDDDFYNGKPLDLGLWRFGNDVFDKDLIIKILPLQKSAPIYIAKWPPMDAPSLAAISTVELIEERQVTATVK